jgi:DNA processing protein
MIQRGEAKLVRNITDILDEFGITTTLKAREIKPAAELNIFEEKILSALEEPLQIDVISEKCGMPSSECLVTLLSLEFKGLAKQLPGKVFGRL